MASEQSRNFSLQTARMAEEIGRTRDVCARTLEMLQLPIPSTFLGNRLDPLQVKEEDGLSRQSSGTPQDPSRIFHMNNRGDEIDKEIRHLHRLARQLIDERALNGIKVMIADLEVEKASLPSDKE